MPTQREMVSNRPLAGVDLAKIILADVQRMLDADGNLSGHIAYGRVSYQVRLTIHTDNPTSPKIKSSLVSRIPASNETDERLQAIEAGPPPLADASENAYVADVETARTIDSPNKARVEFGLPVTVNSRAQDGRIEEHEVEYPKEILGEEDRTVATETDHSAETRARWNK